MARMTAVYCPHPPAPKHKPTHLCSLQLLHLLLHCVLCRLGLLKLLLESRHGLGAAVDVVLQGCLLLLQTAGHTAKAQVGCNTQTMLQRSRMKSQRPPSLRSGMQTIPHNVAGMQHKTTDHQESGRCACTPLIWVNSRDQSGPLPSATSTTQCLRASWSSPLKLCLLLTP